MVGAIVWFATRAPTPPLRVARFVITPPSATAMTMMSNGFAAWPSRLMARAWFM